MEGVCGCCRQAGRQAQGKKVSVEGRDCNTSLLLHEGNKASEPIRKG